MVGEGGDSGGGRASREGVDDFRGGRASGNVVRGWRGERLVGRSAWTVRWGELLGTAGLGGRASAVGVRRERALWGVVLGFQA